MRQAEPQPADPLPPLDWLRLLPTEHGTASSDRLSLTHHRLFLFARPPEELDLRYEGVKRTVPPPAGSVSLLPAGSPGRVRSSGCKDELHVFLEPGLVARVAAEAFDLDPARLTVPPLDGLDLPQLRAVMGAVNA